MKTLCGKAEVNDYVQRLHNCFDVRSTEQQASTNQNENMNRRKIKHDALFSLTNDKYR